MARCQTKFATQVGLDDKNSGCGWRLSHAWNICGSLAVCFFIMRNQQLKAATVLILLASAAALFWNLRAGKVADANEPKTVKPAAVFGQPFTVEIGKSTSIPAQKLDVSFERVTEDSRCPRDVECFWSGQISVVVGLKKANKKLGTANLTVQGSTYVTPKSIGKIGGYWVKIIEVAPERDSRSSDAAQRIMLLVQTKPFPATQDGH